MARRTFDVVDVTEILIHWHAGRSQLQLAASLGVSPKTVRKYTAPAIAAGMVPGGPPLPPEAWAELARGWFPGLADSRLRQVTWPEIAAHHERIREQLGEVTVSTIHQRLRDEHGLAASLASVRRYVRANFAEEARRAAVTVLRGEVPPGSEGQVDYGLLGRWVDPVTQRARRVWAFVLVLACSRHLFVRPVLTMDQRAWVAAHVAAFEFFGGCPARLVPDNLRTGVDRPDLYDPRINRSYGELAAHYGVLIDPARQGKPKDKPRVERPMPYVRDSLWAGRSFTSLAEMQAAALIWCRQVAGRRSCRPLGGAAPLAVFDAVEAAALRTLPAAPFELAVWSSPKVGPDIHVKVGPTLYSVPWRHLGRRLDARATDTRVELFWHGELVKTHPVKAGGRQTDFADYPEEKVAFGMRTPVWCRERAGEIGPACADLIGELLAVNALFRLRAAQGVLGLAQRHDPARLERACQRALDVGDPSYRTVRGILAAGAETDPPPPNPGDGGAPALLHGQAVLFSDLEPADQTTPSEAAS
jgi:transposase